MTTEKTPNWYADEHRCQHGGWRISNTTPWILRCTACGDMFYVMRTSVVRKLRQLIEKLLIERTERDANARTNTN